MSDLMVLRADAASMLADWLEGLGLLRLGERAGIQLADTEYRYCPPLARVPMTLQYNGDWGIRVQPRP